MIIKLKFTILLIAASTFFKTTKAQFVFQKSYFNNSNEQLNCIIQTQDGGFAAVGQSYSTINQNDVWLLKTNANGDIENSKIYSTSGNEIATSIAQLSNGDYLICGTSTATASSITTQIFVSRLDSLGNIIWSKTYDAIKNETAKSLIVTINNEILVAGSTTSVGIAYPKGLLLALDINGNQLWSKVYTQINTQSFNKVIQTSDGGYLAVGSIVLFGNTDKDIVVTKVDVNGNYQWSNSYGDLSDEEAFDAIQVGTDYFLTGYTASAGAGSRDMYIIRLDTNGNILNGRVVGTGFSETAFNIHLFDPSTLVITGYSEFSIAQPIREVNTILKSDLNLNVFQAIYLGDTLSQSHVVSSVVTNLGKVAMAGFYVQQGQPNTSGLIAQNNLSYSQACNEYYPIIATASYIPNTNTQNYVANATLTEQNLVFNTSNPVTFLNSICFTTAIAATKTHNEIEVFPNPVSADLQLVIPAEFEDASIIITTVNGCVLISKENQKMKSINVSSLSAGIYFIQVKTPSKNFYSKFIKD